MVGIEGSTVAVYDSMTAFTYRLYWVENSLGRFRGQRRQEATVCLLFREGGTHRSASGYRCQSGLSRVAC